VRPSYVPSWAVWGGTLALRHLGPSVRLSLDVLLAIGGARAAAPGRRAGGPVFGEHGNWTSLIIALPIGFGIAAAAELWHLLRGTGGSVRLGGRPHDVIAPPRAYGDHERSAAILTRCRHHHS
jgi:hypothetical protein